MTRSATFSVPKPSRYYPRGHGEAMLITLTSLVSVICKLLGFPQAEKLKMKIRRTQQNDADCKFTASMRTPNIRIALILQSAGV